MAPTYLPHCTHIERALRLRLGTSAFHAAAGMGIALPGMPTVGRCRDPMRRDYAGNLCWGPFFRPCAEARLLFSGAGAATQALMRGAAAWLPLIGCQPPWRCARCCASLTPVELTHCRRFLSLQAAVAAVFDQMWDNSQSHYLPCHPLYGLSEHAAVSVQRPGGLSPISWQSLSDLL